MATQISQKKRKFVADAAFYVELEELLTKELAAEYGYSGVDVRDTPIRTENIIKPTPTQNVVGEENKGVDISCSKENQMSSGQS